MAGTLSDGLGSGMGLGSAAASILQRGVDLDNKQRYTESLVCYQEGLQLLVDVLKGTTDASKRTYLRKKVDEYMTRAEHIKKHIDEQKALGSYREQVVIEANSKGHGYATVFGRFLDNEVQTIDVKDPYIRNFYQCQNFLRFCELAVRNCKNLKYIILTTSLDQSSPQLSRDQQQAFDMLKRSLLNHGVTLTVNLSGTLHDRTITLSNGWNIKIGRGLDYFQPPGNNFSLGFFDLDLRPCRETTVDIFHTKDVHLRNS